MLRASKIALCLVLTCVACATTNAAFAKVFSPETFSLKKRTTGSGGFQSPGACGHATFNLQSWCYGRAGW